MASLKTTVARRLEEIGKNAFEAARDGGLERNFINDILNDKKKTVRGDNLNKLAKGLNATPSQILTGSFDDMPEADLPSETDVSADLSNVVMLPEYDVRLSAGDGFYVGAETTKREWPYPRFLVVDQLGVSPNKATVQEVIGDSMEPTLSSGDYVLIDMNDTRIGLPGIFAVWDGDALVCKRVERIPGSEPREVRIKSDNPLHGEYRVPEEQVRIIGRIRWITRRA
ncbi:MAG: S24 family peptidase [Janthinobacterium lividum]